jgi:HSP20 family protein
MQQETNSQRQEGRDQSAASDAQRSIPTSDEGTRRRNQSTTPRTEGRDSRGRALRVGGSWLPTPWALMRRLSEELEQLVDSTALAPADGRTGAQYGRRSTDVARSGPTTSAPALDVWTPSTEVIERPDAIVVRADLPGLTPDDVEVTVQDNVLTISGERRQENQEENDGVIRSEITYGSFARSIVLPDGADPENIKASFRDGVLEVSVPVSGGRERGKRIEVQAGR